MNEDKHAEDGGWANRVLKYNLPLSRGQWYLDLPFGARVLSCGLQPPATKPLVLWVFVPKAKATTERRFFEVKWTGEECPNVQPDRFIGTLTDAKGLVWHVFEVG